MKNTQMNSQSFYSQKHNNYNYKMKKLLESYLHELFPYFSVAQFPKKEQTKVDRSTVVLNREARAVISLNGVTQQGHQQLSASLNLEDLLRQTVEGQGKEDVAFANKKVGYYQLKTPSFCA